MCNEHYPKWCNFKDLDPSGDETNLTREYCAFTVETTNQHGIFFPIYEWLISMVN